VQQLGIAPLQAPRRVPTRAAASKPSSANGSSSAASFFHNEFGRQIEYVGLDLIPQLIPGLTPGQQNQLEQTLQADGAYEQSLNTQAYRAIGAEATVEGGIGKSLFLPRRLHLSRRGRAALLRQRRCGSPGTRPDV